MKSIAVFASGNGTNLQAIIDNIAKGLLKARLGLVVSDRKHAVALKRAKKAGLKAVYANPKKFRTTEAYENHLLGLLRKEKADVVVLAGFMRILTPFFVKKYRNRILNIHPALLPAFKGRDAIKEAFRWGVKVTGVTVHLVDEKVDHGPIIAQEPLTVTETETLEELEARIHILEHKMYPKAIGRILEGNFSVRGRRVRFFTP